MIFIHRLRTGRRDACDHSPLRSFPSARPPGAPLASIIPEHVLDLKGSRETGGFPRAHDSLPPGWLPELLAPCCPLVGDAMGTTLALRFVCSRRVPPFAEIVPESAPVSPPTMPRISTLQGPSNPARRARDHRRRPLATKTIPQKSMASAAATTGRPPLSTAAPHRGSPSRLSRLWREPGPGLRYARIGRYAIRQGD